MPELTGSLTQYTNAAKLVDSLALESRLVLSNLYDGVFLTNYLHRTVVWAKAIVTIIHLLALPGRNTIHSACAAIVDFIIFSTPTMCLFFMLRTAINTTKIWMTCAWTWGFRLLMRCTFLCKECGVDEVRVIVNPTTHQCPIHSHSELEYKSFLNCYLSRCWHLKGIQRSRYQSF